jgi:hypothetical protein
VTAEEIRSRIAELDAQLEVNARNLRRKPSYGHIADARWNAIMEEIRSLRAALSEFDSEEDD